MVRCLPLIWRVLLAETNSRSVITHRSLVWPEWYYSALVLMTRVVGPNPPVRPHVTFDHVQLFRLVIRFGHVLLLWWYEELVRTYQFGHVIRGSVMCYCSAMLDGQPGEAIDPLGLWGPYNLAHCIHLSVPSSTRMKDVKRLLHYCNICNRLPKTLDCFILPSFFNLRSLTNLIVKFEKLNTSTCSFLVSEVGFLFWKIMQCWHT